jgi:hypothetical protein
MLFQPCGTFTLDVNYHINIKIPNPLYSLLLFVAHQLHTKQIPKTGCFSGNQTVKPLSKAFSIAELPYSENHFISCLNFFRIIAQNSFIPNLSMANIML